jgi:uncharacterized LabA/DUF88 family protein
MKKVIILIDGQNLYYSIKELGLKEIDIDWAKFFNHLIDESDELLRIYWFRPEKISDHKIDIYKAKFHASKLDISAEELLEKAQEWYNKCLTEFKSQSRKYDLLKQDYEGIALVKKGVIKVNPWKQLYLGEKGVDVSLAVTMIKFMHLIDKVILVSGDYDYSEAIEYVKENMKKVHLVRFLKDGSRTHSSMSKELALCADKVIDVKQTDLKTTFKRESQ